MPSKSKKHNKLKLRCPNWHLFFNNQKSKEVTTSMNSLNRGKANISWPLFGQISMPFFNNLSR